MLALALTLDEVILPPPSTLLRSRGVPAPPETLVGVRGLTVCGPAATEPVAAVALRLRLEVVGLESHSSTACWFTWL